MDKKKCINEGCKNPNRDTEGYLPATTEYFYKAGNVLTSLCKKCHCQYTISRRPKKKEEPKDKKRCSNRDCQNPDKDEAGYLPATTEHFKKSKTGKLGLNSRCKHCKKIEDKQYVEKNREKLETQWKEYRETHKEEVETSKRKCYYKRQDYYKEKAKKWEADNKERKNERARKYEKKRRAEDPEFHILFNLRRRIRGALKGIRKTKTTRELLGIEPKYFRKYLEEQFQEGMTWENYGSQWHLDHIIPCATFNLIDPEEQKRCFHYTNIQPLWAEDNLRKQDTIQLPVMS